MQFVWHRNLWNSVVVVKDALTDPLFYANQSPTFKIESIWMLKLSFTHSDGPQIDFASEFETNKYNFTLQLICKLFSFGSCAAHACPFNVYLFLFSWERHGIRFNRKKDCSRATSNSVAAFAPAVSITIQCYWQSPSPCSMLMPLRGQYSYHQNSMGTTVNSFKWISSYCSFLPPPSPHTSVPSLASPSLVAAPPSIRQFFYNHVTYIFSRHFADASYVTHYIPL